MKDLIGSVDLKKVVQWRHLNKEDASSEDEKELAKKEKDVSAKDEANDGKEEAAFVEKPELDESVKEREISEKVMRVHATPVLRESVDGDVESDNPSSALWSQSHTATSLRQVRDRERQGQNIWGCALRWSCIAVAVVFRVIENKRIVGCRGIFM